ncbi:hypothetical protein ZWY2020_003942 [Hordeum vulgare]|nr:hypothetical protein ZWY2020_003942 [Hordeum vulgare]
MTPVPPSPSPPPPASPRVLRRLQPDPATAPRILLRGECSYAASDGLPCASSPVLMGDRGWDLRDPRERDPSPVREESGRIQGRRVKSIIVDSSGTEVTISGPDPGWTEVARRGSRLTQAEPSVPRSLPGTCRSDHRVVHSADGPRDASHLLSPFTGGCFRCLSKRHRLASCRDPVHCLSCRRAGHIASRCPRNRKAGISLRDRLGPTPRVIQLSDRLWFPPPPPTAMALAAPSMLRHLDSSRRPERAAPPRCSPLLWIRPCSSSEATP